MPLCKFHLKNGQEDKLRLKFKLLIVLKLKNCFNFHAICQYAKEVLPEVLFLIFPPPFLL
jgi:hypothetical protein